MKKGCEKPLYVVNAMFCDSLIAYRRSKLISMQLSKKKNLCPRKEEIATVVEILLLSGYCRVPQRDLYCFASPDTHNEAVSKSHELEPF